MKTIIEYINEAIRGISSPDLSKLKEVSVIYDDTYKAQQEWEDMIEREGDEEDAGTWEDYINMCWEDAQEAIKDMDNCTKCAIVGEAELWHGKKQIIPTEADSLMEAINDCMGRSCDNLRLTILDDYTVKCEVGHHDGLNVFNIIGLNDNGWEAFDEWAESDDDMPIDFLYDKKNRFEFKLK